MRVGTLRELNVKVGDKVRNLKSSSVYEIRRYSDGTLRSYCLKSRMLGADWWGLAVEDSYDLYELLEEEAVEIKAGDEMKSWKYMTPEEKGALLLASHEGKTLQYWKRGTGGWEDCLSVVIHEHEYYRVKPKPVVKEVVLEGFIDHDRWYNGFKLPGINHKITFNLVDGEPDCNSIKMSKL